MSTSVVSTNALVFCRDRGGEGLVISLADGIGRAGSERREEACGDSNAELSEHRHVLAGGLYERTSGTTGQPLGAPIARCWVTRHARLS
jgi:hypothetical protein